MDTEIPQTAIDYIHSLGRFSGKPGLHRIRALCAALGDPQDGLHFVHLAGTNGKGSTACMTASILQAAGYRVGLYTSPYLVQFYERIRVDGAMIPDADLTRLAERVAVACESLALPEGESIGEFEFTTALAFLYFAEQVLLRAMLHIPAAQSHLHPDGGVVAVVEIAEVFKDVPLVLRPGQAVIHIRKGNRLGKRIAIQPAQPVREDVAEGDAVLHRMGFPVPLGLADHRLDLLALGPGQLTPGLCRFFVSCRFCLQSFSPPVPVRIAAPGRNRDCWSGRSAPWGEEIYSE